MEVRKSRSMEEDGGLEGEAKTTTKEEERAVEDSVQKRATHTDIPPLSSSVSTSALPAFLHHHHRCVSLLHHIRQQTPRLSSSSSSSSLLTASSSSVPFEAPSTTSLQKDDVVSVSSPCCTTSASPHAKKKLQGRLMRTAPPLPFGLLSGGTPHRSSTTEPHDYTIPRTGETPVRAEASTAMAHTSSLVSSPLVAPLSTGLPLTSGRRANSTEEEEEASDRVATGPFPLSPSSSKAVVGQTTEGEDQEGDGEVLSASGGGQKEEEAEEETARHASRSQRWSTKETDLLAGAERHTRLLLSALLSGRSPSIVSLEEDGLALSPACPHHRSGEEEEEETGGAAGQDVVCPPLSSSVVDGMAEEGEDQWMDTKEGIAREDRRDPFPTTHPPHTIFEKTEEEAEEENARGGPSPSSPHTALLSVVEAPMALLPTTTTPPPHRATPLCSSSGRARSFGTPRRSSSFHTPARSHGGSRAGENRSSATEEGSCGWHACSSSSSATSTTRLAPLCGASPTRTTACTSLTRRSPLQARQRQPGEASRYTPPRPPPPSHAASLWSVAASRGGGEPDVDHEEREACPSHSHGRNRPDGEGKNEAWQSAPPVRHHQRSTRHHARPASREREPSTTSSSSSSRASTRLSSAAEKEDFPTHGNPHPPSPLPLSSSWTPATVSVPWSSKKGASRTMCTLCDSEANSEETTETENGHRRVTHAAPWQRLPKKKKSISPTSTHRDRTKKRRNEGEKRSGTPPQNPRDGKTKMPWKRSSSRTNEETTVVDGGGKDGTAWQSGGKAPHPHWDVSIPKENKNGVLDDGRGGEGLEGGVGLTASHPHLHDVPSTALVVPLTELHHGGEGGLRQTRGTHAAPPPAAAVDRLERVVEASAREWYAADAQLHQVFAYWISLYPPERCWRMEERNEDDEEGSKARGFSSSPSFSCWTTVLDRGENERRRVRRGVEWQQCVRDLWTASAQWEAAFAHVDATDAPQGKRADTPPQGQETIPFSTNPSSSLAAPHTMPPASSSSLSIPSAAVRAMQNGMQALGQREQCFTEAVSHLIETIAVDALWYVNHSEFSLAWQLLQRAEGLTETNVCCCVIASPAEGHGRGTTRWRRGMESPTHGGSDRSSTCAIVPLPDTAPSSAFGKMHVLRVKGLPSRQRHDMEETTRDGDDGMAGRTSMAAGTPSSLSCAIHHDKSGPLPPFPSTSPTSASVVMVPFFYADVLVKGRGEAAAVAGVSSPRTKRVHPLDHLSCRTAIIAHTDAGTEEEGGGGLYAPVPVWESSPRTSFGVSIPPNPGQRSTVQEASAEQYRLRAIVENNRGVYHFVLGEYPAAVDHFRCAVDLEEALRTACGLPLPEQHALGTVSSCPLATRGTDDPQEGKGGRHGPWRPVPLPATPPALTTTPFSIGKSYLNLAQAEWAWYRRRQRAPPPPPSFTGSGSEIGGGEAHGDTTTTTTTAASPRHILEARRRRRQHAFAQKNGHSGGAEAALHHIVRAEDAMEEAVYTAKCRWNTTQHDGPSHRLGTASTWTTSSCAFSKDGKRRQRKGEHRSSSGGGGGASASPAWAGKRMGDGVEEEPPHPHSPLSHARHPSRPPRAAKATGRSPSLLREWLHWREAVGLLAYTIHLHGIWLAAEKQYATAVVQLERSMRWMSSMAPWSPEEQERAGVLRRSVVECRKAMRQHAASLPPRGASLLLRLPPPCRPPPKPPLPASCFPAYLSSPPPPSIPSSVAALVSSAATKEGGGRSVATATWDPCRLEGLLLPRERWKKANAGGGTPMSSWRPYDTAVGVPPSPIGTVWATPTHGRGGGTDGARPPLRRRHESRPIATMQRSQGPLFGGAPGMKVATTVLPRHVEVVDVVQEGRREGGWWSLCPPSSAIFSQGPANDRRRRKHTRPHPHKRDASHRQDEAYCRGGGDGDGGGGRLVVDPHHLLHGRKKVEAGPWTRSTSPTSSTTTRSSRSGEDEGEERNRGGGGPRSPPMRTSGDEYEHKREGRTATTSPLPPPFLEPCASPTDAPIWLVEASPPIMLEELAETNPTGDASSFSCVVEMPQDDTDGKIPSDHEEVTTTTKEVEVEANEVVDAAHTLEKKEPVEDADEKETDGPLRPRPHADLSSPLLWRPTGPTPVTPLDNEVVEVVGKDDGMEGEGRTTSQESVVSPRSSATSTTASTPTMTTTLLEAHASHSTPALQRTSLLRVPITSLTTACTIVQAYLRGRSGRKDAFWCPLDTSLERAARRNANGNTAGVGRDALRGGGQEERANGAERDDTHSLEEEEKAAAQWNDESRGAVSWKEDAVLASGEDRTPSACRPRSPPPKEDEKETEPMGDTRDSTPMTRATEEAEEEEEALLTFCEPHSLRNTTTTSLSPCSFSAFAASSSAPPPPPSPIASHSSMPPSPFRSPPAPFSDPSPSSVSSSAPHSLLSLMRRANSRCPRPLPTEAKATESTTYPSSPMDPLRLSASSSSLPSSSASSVVGSTPQAAPSTAEVPSSSLLLPSPMPTTTFTTAAGTSNAAPSPAPPSSAPYVVTPSFLVHACASYLLSRGEPMANGSPPPALEELAIHETLWTRPTPPPPSTTTSSSPLETLAVHTTTLEEGRVMEMERPHEEEKEGHTSEGDTSGGAFLSRVYREGHHKGGDVMGKPKPTSSLLMDSPSPSVHQRSPSVDVLFFSLVSSRGSSKGTNLPPPSEEAERKGNEKKEDSTTPKDEEEEEERKSPKTALTMHADNALLSSLFFAVTPNASVSGCERFGKDGEEQFPSEKINT